MKKTMFALIAVALVGLAACGEKKSPTEVPDKKAQTETEAVKEKPSEGKEGEAATGDAALSVEMDEMVKTMSIGVDVEGAKPNIRDFAKAICRSFRDYEPNAHMLAYLSDPKKGSKDNEVYVIDESVEKGYISCMLAVEYEISSTVCYWNRSNGHSLVGVWMRETHEGDEVSNAFGFYDYDPAVGELVPDKAVNAAVQKEIKAVKAQDYWITLPKNGKDLELSFYFEEKDNIEKVMKWNGNAFNPAKIVPGLE